MKKIQDSKFDVGIYHASLFARVKAAAGQKTEIACSCLNGRRRRRPISRRRRPRLSTLNGQVFVEVHSLVCFFPSSDAMPRDGVSCRCRIADLLKNHVQRAVP
jgi:hypothetical protein